MVEFDVEVSDIPMARTFTYTGSVNDIVYSTAPIDIFICKKVEFPDPFVNHISLSRDSIGYQSDEEKYVLDINSISDADRTISLNDLTNSTPAECGLEVTVSFDKNEEQWSWSYPELSLKAE